MRISIGDRVLATLICLVMLAFAVFIALLSLGVLPVVDADRYVSFIKDSALNTGIVVAVCLALGIISLKVIFMGAAKGSEPQSVLVKAGENGTVRLSMQALDALILKKVRSEKWVRDAKAGIRVLEDGVGIKLTLTVMPDTVIPELTESLQSSLKEELQTLTGILVKEITVSVEEVAVAASIARVE